MTSAPTTNIPVAIPAGTPAPSTAPGSAPRTIQRSGAPVSVSGIANELLHGTPGRMRLLGALAVLAALVLGATSVNALLASKAAVDRASSNTAQVIRVQSLHVDLLRADALATNAFLVGGLEPPEQRATYDAALAAVATGIAQAAAAQPADGLALGALSEQVQTYAGLVQQARTNNRQGLPVGAQYLKEASAGLRSHAIPIVDSIVEANEARAQAEFDRSNSSVQLFAGGAAVIVLLLVAVWLARRTHRYVNPSLAGAIVLSLVALFVAASSISSIGSTTSGVASGDYRDAVTLANIRTAANDARANESLTLIARGSGAANEKLWAANAASVDKDLQGVPDLDSRAWTAYQTAHAEIRKTDDSGNWDKAVQLATATTAQSAGAQFEAFDTAVTEARDAASERAVAALNGVGSSTTLFAILIGLAALVACWLVIRGMAQRIGEYK